MEWQPNKKVICPQCLKNGVTDNREGCIDHNGVSCQFPTQKLLIDLVGKSKKEIKRFYKERLKKSLLKLKRNGYMKSKLQTITE